MEYTVINYLFDKGKTVSERICFTPQSKVTGLNTRDHSIYHTQNIYSLVSKSIVFNNIKVTWIFSAKTIP